MSEYQYYEFHALDRVLTKEEQRELRDISTRAEITATSFVNDYQWGNLKADPAKLVERYFDAFLYFANWGTHRLMFRLPRKVVDLDAFSPYDNDETLRITARPDHVILEFRCEVEEPEWEDESWMSPLLGIREQLMRGDLRALYLGWLAAIGYRDEDDDEVEPPVPPGLAKLSPSLSTLADFLCIDETLLEVAASASAGDAPEAPSKEALEGWLKALPAGEKDRYLREFLADDNPLATRAEIMRRFREATRPRKKKSSPGSGRRTVGDLLLARDAIDEVKSREAAEREAKEKARREREQAAARSKHLDALSRREDAAWQEVESLIAMKRPKEYDEAVTLLRDLLDLAIRSGRPSHAEARIRDLRDRHRNKPSLLERLKKAGLS